MVKTVSRAKTDNSDLSSMKPIRDFQSEYAKLPPEKFAQDFPVPFLLLAFSGLGSTSADISSTTRAEVRRGPAANQPEYVAELRKTDRNYFKAMIIVGRSPQADICLPMPTVSKIHAFFTPAATGWTVSHHGSTNGLVVNGYSVPGGESMPLKDGDFLGLGPSVNAWFYSSAGLRAVLGRF